MKSILILLWMGLTIPIAISAQSFGCGTASPDLASPANQQFASWMGERGQPKTDMVQKVIPVFVHVIFSDANSPDTVSNDQLQSQMTLLTYAFRGFLGGVDTEIDFCLAGFSRNLNPALSSIDADDPIQDSLLKATYREDPSQFLNIYVVEELFRQVTVQVLGYATFPFNFAQRPDLDGVVVRNRNFGDKGTAAGPQSFGEGRTVVHEVGHWLNLFHTFEGLQCDDQWTCEISGDCCCDTPPTTYEESKCKVRKNTCNTDNPDLRDPVRNFMSYSYDDCMIEFTNCQKGRMHLALDSMRTGLAIQPNTDCPVPKRPLAAGSDAFVATLFPNPVTDDRARLRLLTPTPADVNLHLYDATGRLHYQHLFPKVNPGRVQELHLPKFPAGLYFLHLSSDTHSEIFKLIVR